MPSERSRSARSSGRSGDPTPAANTAASLARTTPSATVTTTKRRVTSTAAKGKTTSRATSSKVVFKDDEESEPSSASSEDEDSGDAYGEDSDADDAVDPAEEEDDEEPETDDIDEETDDSEVKRSKKRKVAGGGVKTPPSKRSKLAAAGKKKDNGRTETHREPVADGEYSDYTDEDNDSEIEAGLEEGQTIASRIYPAPHLGKVPAGQISRNTFKFLVNLQDPERNDRAWFQSHDPAFRLAEKEWLAFVNELIPNLCEADDELSPWPPKDLIHRIYRDVRFSNDKTPYKRNFSMSLSRSGRKGIWAGFSPRGKSIIAAGVWAPGKNEIASIRHAIRADPRPFRSVISAEPFVKLFGPASESGRGKGKRCNVFGHEDALKTAPKGVSKEHPDIDLLKLRSVAVVHTFEDREVLDPGFMNNLIDVVRVMVPFVHMINDCIALPVPVSDTPA